MRPLRTAQPSRRRSRWRSGSRIRRRSTPRYNIAPMTEVPIVRVNAEGKRELVRMRWGLVPRWAKDPSIGNRMINARGETIADKPSFTMAYRRHRCLLPADGFYEWAGHGGRGASAQAAAAHRDEGRLALRDGRALRALAVARGRGARYLHRSSRPRRTACSSAVHDRMPMIVAPGHYDSLARSRPCRRCRSDRALPFRRDGVLPDFAARQQRSP